MPFILTFIALTSCGISHAAPILPVDEMAIEIKYGLKVRGSAVALLEEEYTFLKTALNEYPYSTAVAELELYQTYFIGLRGMAARMSISEAEFLLIRNLMKTHQPLALEHLASVLGISSERIRHMAEDMNKRGTKLLRRTIFHLGDEEVSLGEISEEHFGKFFDFNSSGPGVIYRGRLVPLTNKQTLFVKMLISSIAEGEPIPFLKLIHEMGWREKSGKQNIQKYSIDINNRCFVATGAGMIEILRGQGVRLRLVQSPKLFPETNFTFGNFRIEAGGKERLAIEVLELPASITNRKLVISEAQFMQLGLSFDDLAEALAAVNVKVMEAGNNRPVIESFSVGFSDASYLWKYHRGLSEFRKPIKSIKSCENLLYPY